MDVNSTVPKHFITHFFLNIFFLKKKSDYSVKSLFKLIFIIPFFTAPNMFLK